MKKHFIIFYLFSLLFGAASVATACNGACPTGCTNITNETECTSSCCTAVSEKTGESYSYSCVWNFNDNELACYVGSNETVTEHQDDRVSCNVGSDCPSGVCECTGGEKGSDGGCDGNGFCLGS